MPGRAAPRRGDHVDETWSESNYQFFIAEPKRISRLKRKPKCVFPDLKPKVWLDSSRWYVDSGATKHFCKGERLVEQFFSEEKEVCMADDNHVRSAKRCDLSPLQSAYGHRLSLGGCLFSRRFRLNLLALGKLVTRGRQFHPSSLGFSFHAQGSGCVFIRRKQRDFSTSRCLIPKMRLNPLPVERNESARGGVLCLRLGESTRR